MLNNAQQTKAWFSGLLAQWRGAWNVASPSVRERVSNGLEFLGAPLQATIYIRTDAHLPIQASAILIRRDPARSDGDLTVIIIDDGSVQGCEEGIVQARLEAMWATMHANWMPGRPPDPPPEPWSISAQRLDDETVLWLIASAPSAIDIDKFITFSFREDPPAPDVEPPAAPSQHLYALGMRRERTAVQRWLGVFAENLLPVLGIQDVFWAERGVSTPWWCALNLPRRAVFGSHDGDVDLVAGPLEFSITAAEWSRHFERETLKWPLNTPRAVIIGTVLRRACEEGFIIWPPRMDTIVACEAKASWFDPSRGIWKATHADEGHRVRGQLEFLLGVGMDRVGFFHVGATKPRETGSHPWFQASADCARATAMLGQLPPIFQPAELALCGYYRAVVGAVPHKSEDMTGAGGPLQVLQPVRPNPARLTASRAWRARLQELLTTCSRPIWPNVYVSVCQRCGKWGLSGQPIHSCACYGCADEIKWNLLATMDRPQG